MAGSIVPQRSFHQFPNLDPGSLLDVVNRSAFSSPKSSHRHSEPSSIYTAQPSVANPGLEGPKIYLHIGRKLTFGITPKLSGALSVRQLSDIVPFKSAPILNKLSSNRWVTSATPIRHFTRGKKILERVFLYHLI